MRALGIDVGGTFTDAVLVCRRRDSHREGADGRAPAGLGRGRCSRRRGDLRRPLHARHDDRDATRCSSVAARAPLSSRTRASSTSCTSADRPGRTSIGRAPSTPPPLVPLDRCVGVRGRTGPDGELVPLDLSTLPDIDAEAIAVSLLFSFRDSAARAGGGERAAPPATRMLTSSHPTKSRRSFASTSARRRRRSMPTSVRCSLATWVGSTKPAQPQVFRHRSSCAHRAVSRPWTRPPLTLRLRCCRDRPRVSSALRSSRRSPGSRMRSRSTWAEPRRTSARSPTARRAGSTSASWADFRCGCRPSPCIRSARAEDPSCGLDEGGALRVGPESARAEPGPACYGRGGTRATVTDANLLLGRLPTVLPGGIELDAAAAERALERDRRGRQ